MAEAIVNREGMDMRCALTAVLLLVGGFGAGDETPSALRSHQYSARSAEETAAWQADLRAKLFDLMKLSDLVSQEASISLNPAVGQGSAAPPMTASFEYVEIQSTPGRRITIAVAKAKELNTPAPAVVAIHGHGGTRLSAYDPEEKIYKQFGKALAEQGFVVVSVNVGQHEVYESGRTLMGERLWDLMRCVDYLQSLDFVDGERIGCAGLSLGGEMSMWLGAMDPRIKAEVSAGFLTKMDQMEQNHCMCWKFDGLRELVDFADLYAMTAPRALQCQNGLLEPETQFTVPMARDAVREILPAYEAFSAADKVQLLVHGGAHEIALDEMVAFLRENLSLKTP